MTLETVRGRVGLHAVLVLATLTLLSVVAGVGALSAQREPGDAPPRVIRVSGMGEVRVTPDQAHVELAVETMAPTARAAGEENARAMDRVLRALTAAGVPRTDIRTSGYLLFPEYARPTPGREAEPEQPRIVGYRARNTVRVRTQDLSRVGQLIDVALEAGANRFQGLQFSLRDSEAAQNQALREATERARRSAETMAAALGVRLGPVVEASTSTDVVQPFYRMEAAAMRDMASVAPTPVEPGEQSVTANVSVAFRIEEG